MRAKLCAVLVVLETLVSATLAAQALAENPAVPPGRDQGGMPVAIIGSGIDYTPVAISARLARDGEGEITGYDYIDDDRQPFARNPAGQDMAEIVLGEGQIASLVLLRADSEDVLSLSRALLFAGKSPARIVLLEGPPRDYKAIRAFASAARYFHDRLFVLAAGDENRDLDKEGASTLRDLPNVVIVAGAAANGTASPAANTGPLTIDVAAASVPLKGADTVRESSGAPSRRAAAHIAALAVRLRASEPAIPATAMKVRIADLAHPVAVPGGIATRHGLIVRPDRYFWQE